MPITLIIGIIILILIFSWAIANQKNNWVFFLAIVGFWTGIVLYTNGCAKMARTEGAKALLKGDLEPHYIYEDSVCIDTIFKEKEYEQN